jgi:hypothetical protein
MKSLFLPLAAALFVSLASAQNFEGTLAWTLHADITDPVLKKQIDDAQKQLNAPTMRAQVDAVLSDPGLRAMLDANPQMKALVEKQLAAAKAAPAGSNPLDSLLPTSITIKAKAGNELCSFEGGAAPSEVLTLRSKATSYTLDRKTKTYSVLTAPAPEPNSAYQITKTAETATILGYLCQKILITGNGQGAAKVVGWTTTAIKGVDARRFSTLRIGPTSLVGVMDRLEGVPLRMEAVTAQIKITMEATAVSKEPLPDTLFQIPAGFTERKVGSQ